LKFIKINDVKFEVEYKLASVVLNVNLFRFCDEFYEYTPVLGPKFKRLYGLKHTPAIAAAMQAEKEKKEKGAKKKRKLKEPKINFPIT